MNRDETSGGDTYLEKLRAELEGSPFWRHMGIRFAGIPPDEARLVMPVSPDLINPNGGLHGGAIASLLDAAIGSTIRLKRDARVSTIYLTTHYVNPVGEGATLHAEAEVAETSAKRIVPVEAKVTDGDGRTIAIGLGAYAVSREPAIGAGEAPD